jgi:hypothetical protein
MSKNIIFRLIIGGLCLLSFQSFGQFSWELDMPTYPNGDLDGHTYTNVGGTPSRDVAISPLSVGSAVTWQSNPGLNPRVLSTSRLGLALNYTNNNPAQAIVSITFTFSSPVCGLNFRIYEIDRGGAAAPYNYVDEVELNATTEGGGSVPTPSIGTSAASTVSGNIITGSASSSGSDNNLITYPANHCVKSLTITYRTGANVQADPNGQAIAIANMNWNSAQPVTLTQWTTEPTQEGVNLSWQTSEEVNNSHFEVQRSSDAQNFEAIGRVAGRGNSTETNTYTLLDASPRLGLNYYRLKQMDFDGKFEYSRVIVAQYDGNGMFRAYPNPATDQLSIELPKNTEAVFYELTDTQGRAFKRFSKREDISLFGVPTGQYFLQVQTTEGTILKQRIIKN